MILFHTVLPPVLPEPEPPVIEDPVIIEPVPVTPEEPEVQPPVNPPNPFTPP